MNPGACLSRGKPTDFEAFKRLSEKTGAICYLQTPKSAAE
jgi:hypothetical protein